MQALSRKEMQISINLFPDMCLSLSRHDLQEEDEWVLHLAGCSLKIKANHIFIQQGLDPAVVPLVTLGTNTVSH